MSRDKLLLAAKLSEGKSLKWWQSVADGITEPLRLEDWLLDFLHSPASTKQRMDDAVWNVFRTEVYRVIGKTPTEQPAETMAYWTKTRSPAIKSGWKKWTGAI